MPRFLRMLGAGEIYPLPPRGRAEGAAADGFVTGSVTTGNHFQPAYLSPTCSMLLYLSREAGVLCPECALTIARATFRSLIQEMPSWRRSWK